MNIKQCLSWVLTGMVLTGSACLLRADDASKPAVPFSMDFEKVEAGKPPEAIFILNGGFSVKAEAGNKFMELPGNPLDTFGVLFGSEGQTAIDVSARIWGTNAGKLFPEFGVGSGDAGGYKLWLLPNQSAVELRRGDVIKARGQYKWTPGTWTRFHLRVSPGAGGKFTIQGTVWADGSPEPKSPLLSFDESETPATGRASAWGQPYAGTPIRFDDLSASPVAK